MFAKFERLARASVFVGALLIGSLSPGAPVVFNDSIKTIWSDGPNVHLARWELQPNELAAPITFTVHLRMRNFAELQARLARGEKISAVEMEARYLPLKSDYDQVVAWLMGQGFSVVFRDNNYTAAVVRGSVAQASRCLNVGFARVHVPAGSRYPEGEFTSAVTAPQLPERIARPVLGIVGLQPHIRPRHVPLAAVPVFPSHVTSFKAATPDDIAADYNISGAWTGAGETIAIVDEAPAVASDLSTFWSAVNSSQSVSNVTQVAPEGPSNIGPVETTLDVEWAGAMAPGAQIRVYYAPNVFDNLSFIANDASSGAVPGLSVLSISWNSFESGLQGTSSLQSFEQTLAQITAAGVTILAAAGDGGSNPKVKNGQVMYSASAPLGVSYPASDPNVTGVGGTTIAFNANYTVSSETVWNDISSASQATGGGISVLFSAPSWQSGVTQSSARCVPDVAAVARCTSPVSGVLGYENSQGGFVFFEGTSVSTPVWAAVTAQINQARANGGLGPIGALNPSLYPLAGSSAFTDITTGSNGAYSAGPGYDLCTGLGVPNAVTLVSVLSNGIVTAPVIISQPRSVTVAAGGNFLLSVGATSNALSLNYQWFQNGTALSGQTGATYSKSSAQSSDAGSYTVTVSNKAGSVTSAAAVVTVNPASSASSSGGAGGGGGGGGGAPSDWFFVALGLVAAMRALLAAKGSKFKVRG